MKTSPLQKAFREVDGCAEHITMLHGMIRDARTRSRSIYVVTLDLAKAFDTVNHELIFRALRRHGAGDHFTDVVRDLYDQVTTRVSNGSGRITGKISIRSGVKQGCPLSPILFNMVLDELVSTLNPLLGYKLANGSQISILAFADDLVLVSESRNGIMSLLRTASGFMEERGLSINPKKSCVFGLEKVRSRKQVTVLTEQFLKIGTVPLEVLGAESTTRYLGVHVGAAGVGKATRKRFREDLGRLVGSKSLKPQQKVEILRSFILPRWRYRLALGRTTVALLCWLGREVRRAVRIILHAPSNLSANWIHLGIGQGGLGVPDPVEIVYRDKARLLDRLVNSNDAAVRFVAEERLWGAEVLSAVLERHLMRARGLDPSAPRSSLCSSRFKAWCKSVQGRGADTFKGECNFWLQGDGLRGPGAGGLFVFACKLRTQTLPCGESCVRGRGRKIPACRKCGDAAETISHILQTCPMMTELRIHRHNRVLDVVKRHLRRDPENTVMMEPRIRSGDVNLQPDLCVKKTDGSAVLDAHVPYELHTNQLAACRRTKAEKYARHASAFREYLNTTNIDFDGIVIGARGAITGSMGKSLMVMGLSKWQTRLMQLRAIEGSRLIWASFMR